MLYRKIQIPVGETKNVAVTQNSVSVVEKMPPKVISEDKAEQKSVHSPEIIAPTVKLRMKTRRFPSGALPMGRILGIIALCTVCFAVGCSITNERVSETIIGISSAAFGVPEKQAEKADEKRPVMQQTTHYERYMPDESETPLEYLSEKVPVSEPIYESDFYVGTETVFVSDVDVGNTAVDGEVLYQVLSEDLSSDDVHELSNQTKFTPDTHSLLSRTPKAFDNLEINPSEPLVLIVHTHGTECYNSCSQDGYVGGESLSRTENTEENVVSMGRRLTEILEGFGIPVIHSEKMCDRESFVHAYSTSADEVKTYLQKYPSIRFVIDLHRDAIESAEGLQKKPVFTFASKNTAQLMLVVGTNEAGANHPSWQENLCLALNVQNELQKDYPGLFRSINLRSASFNQQLSTGYMLLECGAYGNSHDEAERAIGLFATGFARMISEYEE